MYFVLLYTLLIALSQAKQTYVHLPPKIKSILVEKSPACIAEVGADAGILQQIFHWQLENNDTTKKFCFCLFKDVGLSEDTGHFYIDKVLSLYEYSDQKDEIEKVCVECNKIEAENPFETMYKILMCYYVKTPVLFKEE